MINNLYTTGIKIDNSIGIRISLENNKILTLDKSSLFNLLTGSVDFDSLITDKDKISSGDHLLNFVKYYTYDIETFIDKVLEKIDNNIEVLGKLTALNKTISLAVMFLVITDNIEVEELNNYLNNIDINITQKILQKIQNVKNYVNNNISISNGNISISNSLVTNKNDESYEISFDKDIDFSSFTTFADDMLQYNSMQTRKNNQTGKITISIKNQINKLNFSNVKVNLNINTFLCKNIYPGYYNDDGTGESIVFNNASYEYYKQYNKYIEYMKNNIFSLSVIVLFSDTESYHVLYVLKYNSDNDQFELHSSILKDGLEITSDKIQYSRLVKDNYPDLNGDNIIINKYLFDSPTTISENISKNQ